MAEEIETPVVNQEVPPAEKKEETPTEPVVQKDDLAPIKENLNKAYKERDDLKAALEKVKQEKRDAEISRLKEDGKDKEAFEAQLSDKDTKIAALEAKIVELTRDNEVRQQLTSHNFRNERASALAYSSIVEELVRNEDGNWIHKNGKSIKDFVKSFSEDEDNSFLFVPKENRGTTPPVIPVNPKEEPKGQLKGKTQAEVLQLIAEGKIR